MIRALTLPSFRIQHLSILRNFVARNLTSSTKGTVLGLLWIVLDPLISMVMYTAVFGYIFQGRFNAIPDETTLDYAMGIFIGLVIFQFFASVLTSSLNIVQGNENLVKKVQFPLEILPLAVTLSGLIRFLISFALFLIFSMVLLGRVHFNPLAFLACTSALLLVSGGCAFFLAALGVFFRDLGQVTSVAVRLLLYGSAIFYSAQSIPPAFWTFLRYNPVLHLIDQYRSIFLWGFAPSTASLTFTNLLGAALLTTGFLFFNRTKKIFADVL